jgi:hypothetical protein
MSPVPGKHHITLSGSTTTNRQPVAVTWGRPVTPVSATPYTTFV